MATTNKNTKSQLGKGMAALLGSGATPIGANELEKKLATNTNESREIRQEGSTLVNISQIKANKDQPRKIFKDAAIMELAASIKENGVIQPLIVTPDEDGKFLLIAGERRFRASKLAGLDSVPVVIKKATKKETLVMAIIENVQRSDLNCVEEALAYYQLMNEYGLTQEEVAKKIGKDRSTIANFLRILKLPREVLQMIQKDELSFGHAKVLASVKEDELAMRLALEVVQGGLSVRELEKLIKSQSKPAQKKQNKFFDEKIDSLRHKIEQKTGYHVEINSKPNGSGAILFKYGNEAEFNDIFEYIVSK